MSYLKRGCFKNPASSITFTVHILDFQGYSGVLCQTQIDNCASRPCLNGGTCTNGVGSYSCECTPHFTGETCEEEVEGKCPIVDPISTNIIQFDPMRSKL